MNKIKTLRQVSLMMTFLSFITVVASFIIFAIIYEDLKAAILVSLSVAFITFVNYYFLEVVNITIGVLYGVMTFLTKNCLTLTTKENSTRVIFVVIAFLLTCIKFACGYRIDTILEKKRGRK